MTKEAAGGQRGRTVQWDWCQSPSWGLHPHHHTAPSTPGASALFPSPVHEENHGHQHHCSVVLRNAWPISGARAPHQGERGRTPVPWRNPPHPSHAGRASEVKSRAWAALSSAITYCLLTARAGTPPTCSGSQRSSSPPWGCWRCPPNFGRSQCWRSQLTGGRWCAMPQPGTSTTARTSGVWGHAGAQRYRVRPPHPYPLGGQHFGYSQPGCAAQHVTFWGRVLGHQAALPSPPPCPSPTPWGAATLSGTLEGPSHRGGAQEAGVPHPAQAMFCFHPAGSSSAQR